MFVTQGTNYSLYDKMMADIQRAEELKAQGKHEEANEFVQKAQDCLLDLHLQLGDARERLSSAYTKSIDQFDRWE